MKEFKVGEWYSKTKGVAYKAIFEKELFGYGVADPQDWIRVIVTPADPDEDMTDAEVIAWADGDEWVSYEKRFSEIAEFRFGARHAPRHSDTIGATGKSVPLALRALRKAMRAKGVAL